MLQQQNLIILVITQLGFTQEEILKCVENGFLSAFQPKEVREKMAAEAKAKALEIIKREEDEAAKTKKQKV